MLQYFRVAAFEAFRTLRGNLLHTLLSTLGIVIGVAALVSILALGDGMEKFGREQVAATTDLNAISVKPQVWKKVDGIMIKQENPDVLLPAQLPALKAHFSQPVSFAMQCNLRGFLHIPDDTLQSAAMITACFENGIPPFYTTSAGRVFSAEDMSRGDSLIVLNKVAAQRLSSSGFASDLIGQQVVFQQLTLRVIGIVDIKEGGGDMPPVPQAFMPIGLLPESRLREEPPTLNVIAEKTEEVPAIKTQLQEWLKTNTRTGPDGFQITTNEFRVAQMRKGILVFKVVMGLIVGIAILVGGIGIMNVMLMSVTERTREIGIRKAMGAKRKAIGLQFIAEALAISLLGCGLGLVLGIGFMSVAAPIIRHYAEVTGFQATFSFASFVVIAVVAVLIGIAFGAAPAWKASKLSPVEAMRHE